jgi:hypothetical protein
MTPIVLTDIDVHSYPSCAERVRLEKAKNSLADATANARLSRQYGRECNEDGAVIDRTCCQGDHK